MNNFKIPTRLIILIGILSALLVTPNPETINQRTEQ